MSFSEKLTEIMQTRNITAQDISKASYKNISVSNIRSFQNGNSLPNSSQIRHLNKIFGLDFELFLNESKPVLEPVKRKVYKKKKDSIKLIPVDGQCTFPGCHNKATENCHFTGVDQHLLGKGLGKKVSNLFVADLCHDHHIYFDQPNERKSERLASEFKTCILLSIKRKIDRGDIIFK